MSTRSISSRWISLCFARHQSLRSGICGHIPALRTGSVASDAPDKKETLRSQKKEAFDSEDKQISIVVACPRWGALKEEKGLRADEEVDFNKSQS